MLFRYENEDKKIWVESKHNEMAWWEAMKLFRDFLLAIGYVFDTEEYKECSDEILKETCAATKKCQCACLED